MSRKNKRRWWTSISGETVFDWHKEKWESYLCKHGAHAPMCESKHCNCACHGQGTRSEVDVNGMPVTAIKYLPMVYQPKQEETWRCDTGDVKGICPIAKVPRITVPFAMYRNWVELANRINTEWIAYLVGDDTLTVSEMYFPKQIADAGHVEVAEGEQARPGTIGTVHSHVHMGVFFSHEDESHLNWPVEIVVNAQGEAKSQVRIKLECGRYARMETAIMLSGSADVDALVAQVDAAITAGEATRKVQTLTIETVDHRPEYLKAYSDFLKGGGMPGC